MNRLQIAEDFLYDAVNNEMSSHSREDVAFNAGYLFALEALPSSFTGKLEHPSDLVITVAARYLCVDIAVMQPALTFIREQYSLERDGHNVDALLTWALLMKRRSSNERQG